jgi:hypothetical protein
LNGGLELGRPLQLPHQQQGSHLGLAGLGAFHQPDAAPLLQLVGDHQEVRAVALQQGQTFLFGGGCPRDLARPGEATEKKVEQRPVAKTGHQPVALKQVGGRCTGALDLPDLGSEVHGEGLTAGNRCGIVAARRRSCCMRRYGMRGSALVRV